MMTRKPAPQIRRESGSQTAPNSITPVSPTQKRAEEETSTKYIPAEPSHVEAPRKDTTFESISSSNPWESEQPSRHEHNAERAREEELPCSLKAGGGGRHENTIIIQELPPAPQAGSTEATPRSSWESQRSAELTIKDPVPEIQPPTRAAPVSSAVPQSTNPYHRKHSSSGNEALGGTPGELSSADIWGNHPSSVPLQHKAPFPPDPFSEPWMNFEAPPAEPIAVELGTSSNSQDIPGPLTEHNYNASDFPAEKAPLSYPRSMPSQDVQPLAFQSTEFPPTFSQGPVGHGVPIARTSAHESTLDGSADDGNRIPMPPPQIEDFGPQLPPRTTQESERYPAPSPPPSQLPKSDDQNFPPPKPPRPQQEQELPPPQPPRPPITQETGVVEVADGQKQREETAKTKRARETYQIRHVNWYDASSPTNPRRSPIMVQNANGPCPLLALVNALVLSTPVDYATALVETLRVREQVSLGLLLDAVIDELIGRNGDLPDVSDMYAFLVTLHTGMNVNPRFVPRETAVNLMDAPIDGDLVGNLNESRKPGGFEDTREMKLYSTFTIPLIHGWIPPKSHPATAALKRSATTYEDAQNLMFREEELEEKLQRQGLTPEEQVTLEDIASVKYFLSSTATQLTGYGLDTMTETMTPGTVSILFRNDHFSTLYRHPKSGQLLTLVTDMGYAGHDEVVWESLVDVSGEGCEFFSGDFRPVGNVPGDTNPPPKSEDEAGWTTVPSRSRRSALSNQLKVTNPDLPSLSRLEINDSTETPLSPSTEQEDHDLALAMQLQEEEEERDRQDAAARRREDELSQQYLNNSDASGRKTFPGFSTGATAGRGDPTPPPRGRGSGRATTTPIRPPPPRKSIDVDDAPPPSYEQAAQKPAYHPPAHHPAHPNASPGTSGGTQRPRPPPIRAGHTSAYTEHASSFGGSSSPYGQPRRGDLAVRNSRGGAIRGGGGVDPNLVRRRTGPPSSAVSLEDERREKDCVVM